MTPQEQKDMAVHRSGAVRKNDLFRADQELDTFVGALRRPIDDPLQCDPIRTDVAGNVGRRSRGMEIEADRKNSKEEERGKGKARAPERLFERDKNDPQGKKGEEKVKRILWKQRQTKMPCVKPEEVSQENRNERKAKGLVHLRQKKINL